MMTENLAGAQMKRKFRVKMKKGDGQNVKLELRSYNLRTPKETVPVRFDALRQELQSPHRIDCCHRSDSDASVGGKSDWEKAPHDSI
jgi:hypothetical protein